MASHFLKLGLGLLTICVSTVQAQSCDRTTCSSNCGDIDGPINICGNGWQERGKSSLSDCVCTYHDHTVAILQDCVACNSPDLSSSNTLGVYQAWTVICSVYFEQGAAAAVALEPQGLQGALVPVFSQTYLGPIETYVCGAATTSVSTPSVIVSTTTTTSSMGTSTSEMPSTTTVTSTSTSQTPVGSSARVLSVSSTAAAYIQSSPRNISPCAVLILAALF